MAARGELPVLEVVDLRRVTTGSLNDLLDEETRVWREALAWDFAGTPHRAYLEVAELHTKDLAGMSDPKFYYDCSRLYCLGNEAGIRTGLKYLSAAFALGYRNSERARLCPEMEILRKTNPGLFEQAISLSPSK